MYVRQTSRRLADGSRVRYLQLAHKVRDPETGTPRDEILYHFGREDQLDRDQIERLIQSLARFLEPADRARIQAELPGLGPELGLRRSLPYGGSYVLDRLWHRLELDETLRTLLRERSYEIDIERLLFALVANRALDPRSKLSVERWVGRKVEIEGLEEVQAHMLYRAMDFLLEHVEEVQRTVFFSTASLLNLEVDLVFFDTTTTYFEVEEADEEGEGLRRFGRPSKDHRPELPQVVIGLAVTREGIPVRCWVWPGNTNDASVVEEVQADLAGWKLARVVWVVDRGMAGAPQRRLFQRGGGHVIVAEKLRSEEKAVQEALGRPGRFQKVTDTLHLKEITVEEGSETRRFVLVRNPEAAKRDREKRGEILERLEAEITRLNEQRPADEEGRKQHTEKVCRLKAHPLYGRFVRELESGELRIDRGAVRAEEKLDGKCLLSTTDPSLSATDVATGYKQLQAVERSFRTLKHTMELRPLHHRKEERIRAHVLLCWLALLLVRICENETGESWDRLRDELDRLHLVDLSSKDAAFRIATELTPEQRNVLKRLTIDPPRKIHTLDLDPAAA